MAPCQGTGRVWCGCTLQRESEDLLLKQMDLGMKGTERGIVGVSGVWVSVTWRKLLSVKVGKGGPFM